MESSCGVFSNLRRSYNVLDIRFQNVKTNMLSSVLLETKDLEQNDAVMRRRRSKIISEI